MRFHRKRGEHRSTASWVPNIAKGGAEVSRQDVDLPVALRL